MQIRLQKEACVRTQRKRKVCGSKMNRRESIGSIAQESSVLYERGIRGSDFMADRGAKDK